MTAELVALLDSYGLPALFIILALTSAGAPFPDSLLLVAVGSFAEQGDLSFWPAVAVSIAAAVTGDQIGYAVGFWGGRPLASRIVSADRLERAATFSAKWGAVGIFLSRWLVGALGPWINITSGMTAYPWPLFLLVDLAGETIWVILYMSLGRAFSGQVQVIADTMGNVSWAILGFVVLAVLAIKLVRSRAGGSGGASGATAGGRAGATIGSAT